MSRVKTVAEVVVSPFSSGKKFVFQFAAYSRFPGIFILLSQLIEPLVLSWIFLRFFEKDESCLPLKGKLTKIVPGIGAVKRIKPFVSTATLRYINYCSVVWRNCGKTLSDQ